MSDTGDPDITRLLRDLTRELQRLQREVDGGPRTPSSGDLSRFTSEVAIPGLILILETNIRVLQLLRRTIRMADGRDPLGNEGGSQVRARAEQLGETTLAKLDDALAELQSSLDGESDEMDDIVQEARDLQTEIRERLDVAERPAAEDDETSFDTDDDHIDVDVDAELRAIKSDVDDEDEGEGRAGDGQDRSGE
jgi:uncharacterized coiled-coil protein SlyX